MFKNFMTNNMRSPHQRYKVEFCFCNISYNVIGSNVSYATKMNKKFSQEYEKSEMKVDTKTRQYSSM